MLSKYYLISFNGTTISTFLVLPWTVVFPGILILDLNDSEFSIASSSGGSAGSSLKCYHKLSDVFA